MQRPAVRGCIALLCLGALTIRSPAQAPVIRDSAGITIVLVRAPTHATAAFRLEEASLCVVGGNRADPRLDLISVPSAFRLPDGHIVVAESRTREIRVYRCDGTLLTTLGRSGGGPGEFQNLTSAWPWRGDTILASQTFAGPLVVFHPDGGFVRTIPIRGNVQCCFSDGSVLRSRTGTAATRTGAPSPSQPPIAFDRIAVDQRADTLARFGPFPGSEVTSEARAVAPASPGVTVTRRTITAAPFGRLTSARPIGQTLVVGDGSAWEYRLFTADGRLKRIVRVSGLPVPITKADVAAWKSEQLGDLAGAERAARSAALDEVTFPATFPPYRRLEVDEAGRVWLEGFAKAGDRDVAWSVFAADGTPSGIVRIDRAARVLSIGASHIVLRSSDADGFITVSVRRLVSVAR